MDGGFESAVQPHATEPIPVPEPSRELLRRIRFFYDPREV